MQVNVPWKQHTSAKGRHIIVSVSYGGDFCRIFKECFIEYCEDIDSNNIINEDDLCQKNQFWVAIYDLKIITLLF